MDLLSKLWASPRSRPFCQKWTDHEMFHMFGRLNSFLVDRSGLLVWACWCHCVPYHQFLFCQYFGLIMYVLVIADLACTLLGTRSSASVNPWKRLISSRCACAGDHDATVTTQIRHIAVRKQLFTRRPKLLVAHCPRVRKCARGEASARARSLISCVTTLCVNQTMGEASTAPSYM